MNVQCPSCATTFRVDPAKVPAGGVRARCSVCSAVFPVGPVAAEAPVRAAPPPPPPPPAEPPRAEPVRTPPPSTIPVTPRPTPASSIIPPAIPGARPPQPRPGTTPLPQPMTPPRPAAAAGRSVNPFLSQDPGLKARRLARALVSDMVVYHPAKRRDALKAGTIKESFKDEIAKSWEEYVEQVGREAGRLDAVLPGGAE